MTPEERVIRAGLLCFLYGHLNSAILSSDKRAEIEALLGELRQSPDQSLAEVARPIAERLLREVYHD